jgi:hypothetical protein
MGGYLLGALMMSITLGLVIVFSLSNSGAVDTAQNTLSPAADIRVRSNRAERCVDSRLRTARTPRRASAGAKGGKAGQAPTAVATRTTQGLSPHHVRRRALLTLPGASSLASLSHIDRLHHSPTVTVLLVVGFNLVMLWLLEVPLACFSSPRAGRLARSIKPRSGSANTPPHSRSLTALGALLIVKGII